MRVAKGRIVTVCRTAGRGGEQADRSKTRKVGFLAQLRRPRSRLLCPQYVDSGHPPRSADAALAACFMPEFSSAL